MLLHEHATSSYALPASSKSVNKLNFEGLGTTLLLATQTCFKPMTK